MGNVTLADSIVSTRAAIERDLADASRQLAELELMLEDYHLERQHLLRRLRQLRAKLDSLSHEFVECAPTNPPET